MKSDDEGADEAEAPKLHKVEELARGVLDRQATRRQRVEELMAEHGSSLGVMEWIAKELQVPRDVVVRDALWLARRKKRAPKRTR